MGLVVRRKVRSNALFAGSLALAHPAGAAANAHFLFRPAFIAGVTPMPKVDT